MTSSRTLRARQAAAMIAGVVVGSLALVSPAAAGPPVDCDGTIGADSVDRIVVPDGASCTLEGTTVSGNVDVGQGASLVTHGATIGGNVRATDAPGEIRLLATEVGRNIMITGATGDIVLGPEDCVVDPSAGNNVVLRDNHGSIAVCEMSIGANLTLTGNTGLIGVHDNVIGNNLSASGNSGRTAHILDNEVGVSGGGNLSIKGNDSKFIVKRNHAGNHIACSGNTPRPRGEDNTADNGLTGQCAQLG